MFPVQATCVGVGSGVFVGAGVGVSKTRV
jgi:hypothetical protein